MTDKLFLLFCDYEYYCQGYENTYGYFLVYAEDFADACTKLKREIPSAHNIKNKTIDGILKVHE